jgi:germination protein M
VKRALLALAIGLLLAGCGGGSTDETAIVKVYFLRDGKVWPVSREVEQTDVGTAVDELMAGPTDREQAELNVTSEVPAEDAEPSKAGLAQLVYTMTQFASADSVELVGGATYTRADFEEQTPLILVESPLAYEEVSSPLRVTGTANTFEATFQYELKDSSGKVVDEHFVTATSGTGTRGTFDFTTKPFEDAGSLVVFELSAKDGSRVNEVEIPLRTSR